MTAKTDGSWSGIRTYLTLSRALPNPGLGVKGLASVTWLEIDVPGDTNRDFFAALPKSWLGAPERRILVRNHNNLM